jgi:hypothetical protein
MGVVHRWLDVLFEWAGWLAAALFLVPVMTGVLAIVSDRSEIVTAKVWTNHPNLLKDATLANEWTNGTPSGDADALLTELMGSDWFANEVLTGAESSFVKLSSDQQAQQRMTLRRNLKHQTDGMNVLAIAYLTDRPEAGRAVMSSVIASLGNATESVASVQTGAVVKTLDDQAAGARAAMQRALDAVNAYATGKSQSQLLQDPKYQTLAVDATTAINFYLMIESQAKQAQLKQSAIPAIRQATFRVVDAPSVGPKPLDLRAPAVKYAFAALGATAAVEILLVYLIGLRDPRVRSGDEVRKRLGIPYLGSTPTITSVD